MKTSNSIVNEEEFVLNKAKADFRVLINVTLLGICFTIFTFIVAIRPQLLTQNVFLTLQLACSIPFMTSSALARSKQGYTIRENKWDTFGYVTFILGYTFLINVVGLLLSYLISFNVGLIYFCVNAGLAVTYSAVDVSYDRHRLKGRAIKVVIFILLLVILGVLPALYY